MIDSPADLVRRARAGERRALAQVLSLVEAGGERADKVLDLVHDTAGRAHIVGITGAPGAGKSTLVNALISEFRGRGLTCGVLCIDPSSPFSGGAILGDRLRMSDHGMDDGVFIRSLATQGALGGLARPTLDLCLVLDAVGHDLVIIETVGVGQDEVDIATAAHTVIVASPPGLGDGVQAIKAGVLEIADIHAITKSDKPGADRTAEDLAAAQAIGLTGNRSGAMGDWVRPIVLTSAEKGTGIDGLADRIAEHGARLRETGALAERAHKIARLRIEEALVQELRDRLAERNQDLDGLAGDVAAKRLSPGAATAQLRHQLFGALTDDD